MKSVKFKVPQAGKDALFSSSRFFFPYPGIWMVFPVCVLRPGLGKGSTCRGARNSNVPLSCTHS